MHGAIACVISFSFDTLHCFWSTLQAEAAAAGLPAPSVSAFTHTNAYRIADAIIAATSGIPVLWLLDNPTSPYASADLAQGETTFEYHTFSLSSFLHSVDQRTPGFIDMFRAMRAGINIQYHPSITTEVGSQMVS